MQLLNSFFHIQSRSDEGGAPTFDVVLDPAHAIFRAHFPGNPIVPGVCQVQMTRELLETVLGEHLALVRAKNIKYLTVMTPTQQTEYSIAFRKITTEGDSHSITADITAGGTTYTKLSLTFQRVPSTTTKHD